ncbi:30S ribosomal protein S4 [Candidatus Riflebacteria bacterium]
MARYTGSKAKLVRKFGTNLFGNPKFDRILNKKNYAPGVQGRMRRRSKPSDYSVRLREKQKVRVTYGLLEKQFRSYYEKCAKKSGNTGIQVLQMLESRLDNIVYRLGFASSRTEARIWVTHGHISVNEKKLDIPSAQIKPGYQISVSAKSAKLKQRIRDICVQKAVPSAWCEVDAENLNGKFTRLPNREELDPDIKENLIVEYYSR